MSKIARILVLMLVAAVATSEGRAASVHPIERAADRLVSEQLPAGDWGEPDAIGESVLGLVHAFELLGKDDYRIAAEKGGDKILSDAGYTAPTFTVPTFPAEAYALTRLGDISVTPSKWEDAASDLFAQIETDTGTGTFLDQIVADQTAGGDAGITSAVHDIARLSVAADQVNATDTGIYRSKLIETLGEVDDSDDAPVLALGAGVWGLASTGPLDGTTLPNGPVDPLKLGGRPLSGLPGFLAGFQTVDGNFASFFDGSSPGFTETTVFADLGLRAARSSDPVAFAFSSEIDLVNALLLDGIDPDGFVFEEIGLPGSGAAHFLAGETLEAVVPLPPAVWMGLILLGGMGVFKKVQRKMRSAA